MQGSAKTLTCAVCRAESEWTAGFLDEHRLFRRARTICVTCVAYRDKYVGYHLGWAKWSVIALFVGFVVTRSLGDAIVFAVGAYVLLYIALVLHELGHFAAARAVGVEVPVISFGSGVRAKVLRARSTFVLLSPVPSEGLVVLSHLSPEHVRKRTFVILAAGPLTNLLCAALGALALELSPSGLSDVVSGGLLVFVLINLGLGLGNLLPFSAKTAAGVVWSDGAQIWQLRRMSNADIEQLLRVRRTQLAWLEFNYGDMERCVAILEEAALDGAHAVITQTLLTAALANTNQLDRGVDLGRRFLQDATLGVMEQATLRNNLAFTLFLRRGPGDLAEAEVLSGRALHTLPMIPAVKGTRASVLIAQGRYVEGVALLSDRRFRLSLPRDQATVHAMRAKGLAGLSDKGAAIAALDTARALDPANRHLAEAEAAIQALPAA